MLNKNCFTITNRQDEAMPSCYEKFRHGCLTKSYLMAKILHLIFFSKSCSKAFLNSNYVFRLSEVNFVRQITDL